ncbi:7392_t:CDS:2 [Gigaspora margarita]|uniref:7392_t:CDS:1 n=1 Tax=Gigaspora margarita TaxID=4874 RepID=A0ABN7UAX8_GIGMA|nr:7392_t:CDS:2 [Gigaspora margarita]
MSNQRNRVKKIYTPLPLLRVRTKPAKSYKLPVNKSNEHLNNLNNLKKLNEHSNDLSDSEQYSNISNELDQYSSETYQYSSESDKDVDWEINEEEHFLSDVDWENNKSTKGCKLFESRSQFFEGFNGEYGPYFPNFTSTMLFLWITEHMISTTAYEELAKILKHPDFRPEHVVANIRRFRKWRNRLPLLKVWSHTVPISRQHTPSNSVSTKPTYSIMPVDYIESILNNPTIAPYLYFGPGIVCDEKRELWHGELWQDSPLFGETKYHQDKAIKFARVRSVVKVNEKQLLRVDPLVLYHGLPGHLRSSNRKTRGMGMELWLVEGQECLIIPENVTQINVWLKDLVRPVEYEYFVTEILYSFNGRWHIRDLIKRHRAPYEYIPIPPLPPRPMPIKKVFFDIYYDNFGTFRNAYHSLGGVYLVIGNMPLELRKLLKNHFLLGFVPFGASFNDYIKPILDNIYQLQNGKIVNTLEGEIWIVGGLGCVTADLPQGNDLAGVLRHNAKYGCRTCIASSSQLTNSNFDFLSNARFHHLTDIQYNEIAQQKTDSARRQLSSQYGLCKKPVLDKLYWNRHLQTPQDAYHALAGKAARLLDITLRCLNTNGEVAWLKCWKDIKKPARWSRMPNPLTHRQSFTFSDTLRLAMLIPFILRYFLLPSHFKIEIIEHLKNVYQLTRNDHAIIKLIELWVVEAKLLKLAFLTTMTSNTYKELHSLFEKERIGFLKIFPDIFENLPNVHISIHLPQHARTFATLVNTSVGVKEMVHRIYKNMVLHTNYKNLELDLLRRYNTLFALTYLFDGGKDYHFPTTANKISNLSSDNSLYSILYKWYTIDPNFKKINDDDIEEVNIISNLIPKNFIDIVLRNKWSKTRTNNEGWSTKLSSQHPLYHDLQLSYSEYFSIQSAFLYDKLDFFDYISYTIIENDRKSNQLKFHVGDIIEIEEESEGLTYAKIQAILQHQANNTESAIFFVLKWLQETNTKDLILDCPYYKQIINDQQFFRIYPITCINRVQKIHFLPIQNNQKYIKNEFFYEAV